MKLVSMKQTKSEIKETEQPITSSNQYPYGLEISLEKESIDKLDLNINDFSIGGKVDIVCTAEVTSLSQSASKKNENLSVRLQITDLGMGECKMENPKKLRDIMKSLKKLKK